MQLTFDLYNHEEVAKVKELIDSIQANTQGFDPSDALGEDKPKKKRGPRAKKKEEVHHVLEAAPSPTSPPPQDGQPIASLTQEIVLDSARSYLREGHTVQQLQGILQQFQVVSATEIAPENYAAFVSELQKTMRPAQQEPEQVQPEIPLAEHVPPFNSVYNSPPPEIGVPPAGPYNAPAPSVGE